VEQISRTVKLIHNPNDVKAKADLRLSIQCYLLVRIIAEELPAMPAFDNYKRQPEQARLEALLGALTGPASDLLIAREKCWGCLKKPYREAIGLYVMQRIQKEGERPFVHPQTDFLCLDDERLR